MQLFGFQRDLIRAFTKLDPVEKSEPEEVTRAIESEPECSYCNEPLSIKPATEHGLHVDCVHLLNADLDEAFGNPPIYEVEE